MAALLTEAARRGCRLCVFPLKDPRLAPIESALPVEVQRRPLGMVLIVARAGLVAKLEAETGLSAVGLGVGLDLSDEAVLARVFGDQSRQVADAPLPLDIHIDYLDHV